jgi:hypothetical protein
VHAPLLSRATGKGTLRTGYAMSAERECTHQVLMSLRRSALLTTRRRDCNCNCRALCAESTLRALRRRYPQVTDRSLPLKAILV